MPHHAGFPWETLAPRAAVSVECVLARPTGSMDVTCDWSFLYRVRFALIMVHVIKMQTLASDRPEAVCTFSTV